MPLRVWTGTAYVDATPALFQSVLGGNTPKEAFIWDGTKYVKVWPMFTPLRMNKSGSYTVAANSTSKVTGWAPHATSPYTTTAADIVNNELVVNGDGPINVSSQVTRSGTQPGDQSYLYRNGVQVASSDTQNFNSTRFFTWSGTVAKGDRLAVYYKNSSYFYTTNISAGYLEYTLG